MFGLIFFGLIAVWILWALINGYFDGRPARTVRRMFMTKKARQADDELHAWLLMGTLTAQQRKHGSKRRLTEYIRRMDAAKNSDDPADYALVYLIVHKEHLAGKVGISWSGKSRYDGRLGKFLYRGWGEVDQWETTLKTAREAEKETLEWIRLHTDTRLRPDQMEHGGYTETWLLEELSVRLVWSYIEARLDAT